MNEVRESTKSLTLLSVILKHILSWVSLQYQILINFNNQYATYLTHSNAQVY